MQKYYTTHQLAKMFMVSQVTIIKWANDNKLKCTKTLGGHRRITNSQLMDFLNESGLQLPEGL